MPTYLDIAAKKEKFIDASIAGLSKEVQVIQRKLLNLILDEFVTGFAFDESGNIINNSSNILRAAELDKIFTQWNTGFQDSVIKDFTNRQLQLTTFSKDYFLRNIPILVFLVYIIFHSYL